MINELRVALGRWEKAAKTATGSDKVECLETIRALKMRIAKCENPNLTTRFLNKIY